LAIQVNEGCGHARPVKNARFCSRLPYIFWSEQALDFLHKGIEMTEDLNESVELAREFDIVAEIEKSLDEIEKVFELLETDDVPEKISYLKFLVRDLDDLFLGENEPLRYRRFTLKRSK
jgi:hypothetical protein